MDLSLPIRGVRRTISLVAVVVLTASTLCTSVAGRAHATPGGSAPHRAAAPYFTITAGDALGPGLPTDGWAVIGHFASPELDDIIWYRPGAGKELRSTPCRGCQAGPFTTSKLSQQVTGSYQPVVGDFAGDGLDDIL